MKRALQPVTINGISFDAIINKSTSFENDVPSYPVEDGFEVSDSIIMRPITVDMVLVLSNNPVTFHQQQGGNPFRVQEVLAQLRELYFERKPMTVVTNTFTYEKMAIVKLMDNEDSSFGDAREIPISFQQIRLTERRVTAIPAHLGRGGDTGVNAGPANITQGPPAPSASGGSRDGLIYSMGVGSRLLPG